MSSKDLEILLYKNRLNQMTLIDLLPNLSKTTVTHLLRDLNHSTQPMEDNAVHIFTDGNCKRNGKSGSKGGYAVFFTEDSDSPFYNLNYSAIIAKDPTNQKAELMAMLKVFEILHEHQSLFIDKPIIIVSDSMYSIKCLTEWYKNWVRNDWKTSKGEPVKNDLLIKRIIEIRKTLGPLDKNITFKHIHSHTVCPGNRESKEYFLWYGNDRVDKMINEILV
ncbi:hypothetical protein EBU95_08425 [bacterium]|nr:hypothetical protein [bacterium]